MSSEGTSHGPIALGVPVRNEEARLPGLLAALDNQLAAPPFTLCIVFDNCTDGSERLVARLAAELRYPIVTQSLRSGHEPNAGAARRHAMALALKFAKGGSLLTTDADSQPDPHWIAANLAALEQADIVAGRIVCDGPDAPLMHHRLSEYYDRLHAVRRTLDPIVWEAEESHHWTSGASLACRSQVYLQLGGFAPIANGEDAAFADSAARAGYRVRRDANVVVRTSSRRTGRAERGFAAALAALDAFPDTLEVVHPDDEAWRFRMQAQARAVFQSGQSQGLAPGLGLAIEEIAQVAGECANAEAFAARIVGAPPTGMRTVSLAHAEALLAGLDMMTMAGAA